MKNIFRNRRNFIEVVFIILFSILITMNLLDFIFGIVLLIKKDYFTSFNGIPIPQAGRVNILGLGSYSGINFSSVKEVLIHFILAFDLEQVAIIFLIALSYHLKGSRGEIIELKLSFYLLTLSLLLIGIDLVVVIANLIPINNLDKFVNNLAAVSILASLAKLVMIGFILGKAQKKLNLLKN